VAPVETILAAQQAEPDVTEGTCSTENSADLNPSSSTSSLCDPEDSVGPDNIGGFDRVEALASYLVTLVPADNTAISLTNDQATKIISLWNQLDQYDKRPTKFSPHHRTEASGRFKAPKKR